MSSEPYLGSIKTFAFAFPPRGYMLCNGQILAVQQYNALFALLGTTYGGNGQTTFGLPNLQGRVVNGQGNLAGGSSYVMGQLAGTEQVTLNVNQMPQHTHAFTNTSTLNAVQTRGTVQEPGIGYQLARPVDQNNAAIPLIYVPADTAGTQVPLGGVNVAGTNSPAGGSQPFSILQPYLTLNFSIATQGLFPSRN